MRLPATPLGRDVLVAAVLTSATQLELLISAARIDGPLPLQHAAFATMTAAVALRRLAPLAAVLVCAVGMALQTVAGPASAVGGFLALLVVVASLGYHRPVRPGIVGLAAIGVAATLYDMLADTLVVADLVGNVAILLLAWGAARMVRVSTDRRVAAELDRERAASQAVRDERSRIARDLHDSVAHALTVMTLQAGVARERSSEPGAAQYLGAIEQEGREALADMHRFLRLLGEDGEGPAETPGIQDLADLVARVRASGLAVDLAVGPGLADLPASVSATAYRVVQEGLTNAIKHSGADRAEVAVHRSGDQLVVEVADSGAAGGTRQAIAVGSGRGLAGLRERVSLFHGTVAAGSSDGGWQLAATIPVGHAGGSPQTGTG